VSGLVVSPDESELWVLFDFEQDDKTKGDAANKDNDFKKFFRSIADRF
jgi:hypothetical protein